MTEWNDFDRDLMDSLSDLPPSPEMVAAVTPWREAMTRILWGLFLITFHLNNLYLQYILPAVGVVLLYLGFRSLRQSNRWFLFGWYITICKAVIFYSNSILLATPLELPSPLIWNLFTFSLTPLLYISLWQGLQQAAREVGRVSHRQPALWALIWYGALAIVGWKWPNPGMLVFLVILVLYVCIIRALWSVTKDLEEWGYAVQAAGARVSADRFRWLYLGTLLAAVLLTSALSSHNVPDFQPAEESQPIAELTELGLPEDVARQLLPEDLERLAGAVSCKTIDDDHPLYGNDGDNEHQNDIYSFLMPDGSLRVVHLFRSGDEGGFWKCHLKMSGNARLYDLTARLFYTRNGQRMAAGLSLSDSTMESGLDFFGQYYEDSSASFPAFSWPLFSRNRLVYVICSVDQEANPKTYFYEYIHYGTDSLPVFPYAKAADYAFQAGSSFYYGDGSGLMYKADEKD